MKNIALIFAGGTGQRMNNKTKPKQFLELHGKPIIVYTAEHFQYHEKIDEIIIVCISEWINYCTELVKKYNLNKVCSIVPGGSTGQESIFNGVRKAAELFPSQSVILVHDGVRPLINAEIISNCIEKTVESGSAITVAPAVETVVINDRNNDVTEILDRSKCMLARAPQCFILGELYSAHKKAISENKTNFIDSASLMKYYGYDLFTVDGSAENIKITTPIDFYIFRSIIEAEENYQIFG